MAHLIGIQLGQYPVYEGVLIEFTYLLFAEVLKCLDNSMIVINRPELIKLYNKSIINHLYMFIHALHLRQLLHCIQSTCYGPSLSSGLLSEHLTTFLRRAALQSRRYRTNNMKHALYGRHPRQNPY